MTADDMRFDKETEPFIIHDNSLGTKPKGYPFNMVFPHQVTVS